MGPDRQKGEIYEMPETTRIHKGQILTGPIFNEPVRVESVYDNGNGTWVVGVVGTQSERFRKVRLSAQYLASLTIVDAGFSYDGDGHLLRLGLQAYSLGIAWEFDPYFGLSISRVDPLPHQIEAIYDYLLKLARVRFLLADDAGAGKTIMAEDYKSIPFDTKKEYELIYADQQREV